MVPEFVVAARAEAATLERRLAAVRALIDAYDEGEQTASTRSQKAPAPVQPREQPKRPMTWGERPKDQYSSYGRSIVDAAIEVVRQSSQLPIKTRDIAAEMLATGVEIRGNDPVNALGALLARSSVLMSQGKQGWTLATPSAADRTQENAPPSTIFDDVLGGAETAGQAQHGGPQE